MSKKQTSQKRETITSKPLLSAVPLRMKKARESYGLGFSNMSRVCGMGINQWRMYEKGEAEPNASNGHLIRIVTTPTGMMQMLELCPPVTREAMGKRWQKAYDRVRAIVSKIEQASEDLKNQLDSTYFY